MIVTQEQAHRLGCPLWVIRRAMTMDERTATFKPGQLGNGALPLVSVSAHFLHEQCLVWRWADAGMVAEKLPDSCRADDNPRGYCGPTGTPLSLR